MRIFGDVSHAGQNSVAPIFGKDKGFFVQNFHETGMACAELGIALSICVSSGNKYHFLLQNKPAHFRIEVMEQLGIIKG